MSQVERSRLIQLHDSTAQMVVTRCWSPRSHARQGKLQYEVSYHVQMIGLGYELSVVGNIDWGRLFPPRRDDQTNVGSSIMDRAREGEPILSTWHIDVGEKYRDVGVLFQYCERFLRVTRLVSLATEISKCFDSIHSQNGFVIDDKDDMAGSDGHALLNHDATPPFQLAVI